MRRLLTIALLGVCAASAQGSVLLTHCGGRWCHQHTRIYTYRIEASVPSWWAAAVDRAAKQWSDRSTVLTLVKTNGAANITLRGVHTNGPVGQAQVGYHTPATIILNTGRMSGSLLDTLLGYPEGVACHELGHALGLGHGGKGCMASNRQDGDGGQSGLRLAIDQTHPGSDDIALLDRTYPATGH